MVMLMMDFGLAVLSSTVFHRPAGDRESEEKAGEEQRNKTRKKRQKEKGFMINVSLRDEKGRAVN
jgi:hypothetical protein